MTDLSDILQELDAGVFLAKATKAVEEAALSTIEYGDAKKLGEVTIKFKFKRIGDSAQVHVEHCIAYKRPTRNGKATEENTTSTPLYVGRNGRLSIVPESQLDAFKEPRNAD